MPSIAALKRMYTQSTFQKSIWSNVHFSHALKIKLSLYFIPIIFLTAAIPHVFIYLEGVNFNNSGITKMIDGSQMIGVDYLKEYSKTASLHITSVTTRVNIFTDTVLQANNLRKNGLGLSLLSQPMPAVCTFVNITICLKAKYETMNLKTVLKEVYDRDQYDVFFTTTAYASFSVVDEKAWRFIQSFKTLDSLLRGMIGRIRGDTSYMTEVIIFHNDGRVVAVYPAMNVTEDIPSYSTISKLTNLVASQNDTSKIMVTPVIQDYFTDNMMMYFVRGLKFEDDSQISGGIAVGVSIDPFFGILDSVSLDNVCPTYQRYIVLSNGTILYTPGQEILEESNFLTVTSHPNIPSKIGQDAYIFMTSNPKLNETFFKAYNMYDDGNEDNSNFPFLYIRLLSPDVTYFGEGLYILINCYDNAVRTGVQITLSEVEFLDVFHYILDSSLLVVFGLVLTYTVNLFTREILSPIKQISAKFIEITQTAFNSQELKQISFEDILIKEDTEIKDFHNCVCESYNSLIQDKNFLNEGEFQEHKCLYKNKVLKKVYEEKNVLKVIKSLNSKIPEKANIANPTHEGMMEPFHDTAENNVTVASRII